MEECCNNADPNETALTRSDPNETALTRSDYSLL